MGMSPGIVVSEAIVEWLREEFGDIVIPAYKFRRLFSRTGQIFFDCEGEDNEACLDRALHGKNHAFFTVFFVIRDKESGTLQVMDVSFPNIGRETLEHFIKRYHSQLKPSNIMGLEASGREYVKYIGCSYEE